MGWGPEALSCWGGFSGASSGGAVTVWSGLSSGTCRGACAQILHLMHPVPPSSSPQASEPARVVMEDPVGKPQPLCGAGCLAKPLPRWPGL